MDLQQVDFSEKFKKLIIENWGATKLFLKEDLWSDEVKIHEGSKTFVGKHHIKEIMDRRIKAIPDLRYIIDETFTSGNQAAVRWHAEGTPLTEIGIIKTAGKPIKYWGISIFVVKDGKIIENWDGDHTLAPVY